MKVSSVNYLVKQGVKSVWTNRMMSFASFCILLVSLMMVGLSALAGLNLSKIIGGVESKNEIVVIIKDGTSQAEIDVLNNQISTLSNVVDLNFYSRTEAWDEMIKGMSPAEQEFLQYAEGDNPLPDTFRLRVDDIEKMGITTAQIESFEHVDLVQSPTAFADALVNIKNIVALISAAVVIALIVVCLVIISNTTRTSVFARRKEISIMKYVGATNRFIRIPFFIEGMFIGTLAALGALVLTRFAYIEIYNVLNEQFDLLSILGVKSIYSFTELSGKVTIAYIAVGAGIGALGTTISTGKYLKV